MWGVHRALEGSEESHKRSSLLKKSLSKRSMGRRRTQTLPKQVQTTYKWTSRSLNKAQKRTRARCLDKPPCKGRTISGTGVSCSPGPRAYGCPSGCRPFPAASPFSPYAVETPGDLFIARPPEDFRLCLILGSRVGSYFGCEP